MAAGMRSVARHGRYGRLVLAVAIDTASDMAGVALVEDGELLAETTWRSRQNHSRQLLPTFDWLLQRCERTKTDLGAIIVCLGPGSYAGLRVGLSTAKALAFGLELPIVGVGRLAADAYQVALTAGGKVVAIHAAGRAELAWAVYSVDTDGQQELQAPRLGRSEQLREALDGVDVICGELKTLDEALKVEMAARGLALVDAYPSRVVAVARLGWHRITRGDVDNLDTLVPLYLRAPAIGPQTPPS